MTVMPGSLDYLYYNGVLDHIPYEAYEITPATKSAMAQNYGIGSTTPQLGSIKQSVLGNESMGQAYGNGAAGMSFGQDSGINGSQYLDSAMNGGIYGSYGNSSDSFSRSGSSTNHSVVDRMLPETYGYSSSNGINYPYSQYGVNHNSSGQSNNGSGTTGANIGLQGSNYGLGNNINYSNPSAAINGYAGVGKNFNDISGDYSGSDFRNSITASAKEAKNGAVFSTPSLWKGLLALGVIIATPILIIKGRKKPSATAVTTTATTSFWSKLNPKNWFK